MTTNQYSCIVKAAAEAIDYDAYISGRALSSILGVAEDGTIPTGHIEQLSAIWVACHRSVKEIAAATGLSQRKLAERLCVPYRTVENWCGGQNECPTYTRLMMQECLGLFSPPID